MLYAFSEKLKFVVFIIDKTASKSLIEEQQGQSENEKFEVFRRVILLQINIF